MIGTIKPQSMRGLNKHHMINSGIRSHVQILRGEEQELSVLLI